MAIEFSRAAEDDLLEIFFYCLKEHGTAQAERYKARLVQSLQVLSDNPKIADLRQQLTPPVRVYPARTHVIVYTIGEDGETVFVLRAMHRT